MRTLLGACLACAACGPAAPAASPQPQPQPQPQPAQTAKSTAAPPGDVSCEAEVETLGNAVVGDARGGKDDDVEAEARRKACEELLKTADVDCNDSSKLMSSRFSSLTIKDGVTEKQAKLTLRPVVGTVTGAGTGTDFDTACRAAVANACKRAPSGALCTPEGVGCRQDDPEHWSCAPIRRMSSISGIKPVERPRLDLFGR